ncbi:MAG TPA: 2'-5' RNA ligase family protein, partial [Clostridia bacterium]|nr:2'-5' RNA ligase family protein [Clostridia bacterium]
MNREEPNEGLQSGVRERLREHYDQLWSATIEKIRAGKVEVDPTLEARLADKRRGLTVIAQPEQEVQQGMMAFLAELKELEPDQHYYSPASFHLTVLSLFTATIDHGPFFARKEEYIAAVDAALQNIAPFQIEFEGITVSPGAVMIQGFFEDDALNNLRESLRDQLRGHGLAE